MTFEIAISTMHKTKEQCIEMLKLENIHCNCIIINQCDIEDYFEEIIGSQKIRIFFTRERGLSKSRNKALQNMNADIMAIADDDLIYYEGFEKIIIDYYEFNPKADIVLFNIDNYEKQYSRDNKRCGKFELSGYISMQVTFTKQFIRNNNIKFNEFFGTGSGYFSNGEECIFLANCYSAGARIFYCSNKILKRPEAESSWFNGYDEVYLKSKGAIYYAMSNILFIPYILRFALLKRKLVKNCSILKALRLMLQGKNEYLSLLKTR